MSHRGRGLAPQAACSEPLDRSTTPRCASGVPPFKQGTIHTGASWMCAARYSAASSNRRNRSRLKAGAGSPARHRGATCSSQAACNSPNCPFDLGVLDHEEPPTLHISAARRTNTRLHTSAFPIRRRAELACPTAWIKPQLAVLIKNAPDGENLITLPLLERNTRLVSLLKGAPGLLQYNDHQIGDGSAQRAMGNRFLPGQDRIAISRNITGLDFLVISRSRPIS